MAIRIKPTDDIEKEWMPGPEIEAGTIINYGGGIAYQFDSVHNEESTTQELYDQNVRDIVTSACNGRNGTIPFYGQTST